MRKPKQTITILTRIPKISLGLRVTWREILDLRRKFLTDPDFKYMPMFPVHGHAATNAATDQ